MFRGDNALVMGAGIAGLLAARVLADHFSSVTVIEKDPCPTRVAPRPGVPQGRQTHVLLPGGVAALENLLPGLSDELIQDGSRRFDYGQSRFHLHGNWMPRIDTGLYSLAQTRPFLEEHIRRRVGKLENVHTMYESRVCNLVFEDARRRVAGVVLDAVKSGNKKEIRADLVIDATGRRTRLPEWFVEHKIGKIIETHVGIDVGYATGCFRVPERVLPDYPLMYIVGRAPEDKRVGALFQVEGQVFFSGMAGYHGDHPPGDLQGFLAFAKGLSQPEIHSVLTQSELISPLARYRAPASVRRHYARVSEFPDGLLPIGDAISCFDPVFAQGMSVAILEAEVLGQCLKRNQRPDAKLARDYLARVDSIIDVSWNLSTGEDLKYPQTTGRRPLLFPLSRYYKQRLTGCSDPAAVGELYKVLTLTASPHILLRPRTMMRALFSFERRRLNYVKNSLWRARQAKRS